jgi:hypothetical protein
VVLLILLDALAPYPRQSLCMLLLLLLWRMLPMLWRMLPMLWRMLPMLWRMLHML